jgi:hypothetical protein
MNTYALKTGLATALAAALIVINTVSPHAYATYSSWSSPNVTVYINPANSDGLSDSAVVSAIQAAMNDWNTQGASPFRFNYGGQVRDTTTGYDGRNVVLFRNETNSGYIAYTYSWWDASQHLADSDTIIYDPGYTYYAFDGTCDSSSGYGVYLEDLTIHEFGHMLGLSHSSEPAATMYAGYAACSTTQRSLDADDIAGIQSLYGRSSSSSPSNSAPNVTISSPGNNGSYAAGSGIPFSGSASDTQDGNLTSRMVWSSSIDGPIGTGGSFSRTLSSGAHTITAAVTDAAGLTSSKSVNITVTASSSNTAPTASISSPGNNASFAQGTAISFSGSASDAQDGNLTAGLRWTSNIDGAIGNGGSFSRALSAGAHTITASVTDSGGMSGTTTVTITVVPSAPGGSPASTSGATLTARGYKTKGVQKADLSWSGLTSGQIDVYRDNVLVTTTGNSGSYTDNIGKRGSGTYTYSVCEGGTSTCSNSVIVSF